MPRSHRNFPDDPAAPWEDHDEAPMLGPTTTEGGSVETPPTAGTQPMQRAAVRSNSYRA